MQHSKEFNRSRRRFIVGLSLAGVATGSSATGIFALKNHQSPDYSDDAYAAWQQPLRGTISDEQYMVHCATLAPSAHNTQPWKFRIQPQRIQMFIDTDRLLGNADPEQRQVQQGLGCALENMLVTAGYLGYESTVTFADDTHENGLVAEVSLATGVPSVTDEEFQTLFSRQTNRGAYDMEKNVPSALLDNLERQAGGEIGLSFHRAQEESTAYLLGYMRSAVRELVANDQYYLDSIKWWRYTREELVKQRDGISIHTSDAPFFVKEGMEQFVDVNSWSGEFGRQGEIDVLDNIAASTPVWGVIWSQTKSQTNRIKAGQLLEKAYLDATGNGMYVHPVSYIAESPELSARFMTRFGLPETAELLSIFRLGHAPALEKSPRINWKNKLIA